MISRVSFEGAEVALVDRKEGRLLVVKEELHLTHGTVAVLLHQDFSDIGTIGFVVHLVLTVDEHNNIGILLNRTGVSQVRETRAATALFYGA